MLSSKEDNKVIENLNNKILEITKDRGIITSYLLSLLSKITNYENTSQFKLMKDHNSNRANDLVIHNTIPVTLYNKLLTFRDTGKLFEIKGKFFKLTTNKNYNVDLASTSDKKNKFDFAKDMSFDVKAQGKKRDRDGSLKKLLKTPGLLNSAFGISKTIFLPSDTNELCDRLKLLLQQKQTGNNSDIFDNEIVEINDKLLEYKCISKRQHKQSLFKCSPLHTKKK